MSAPIVGRLRCNFHYEDCPEYEIVEQGDDAEREDDDLCRNDCVWHRLDEAADHIEKMQRDRRMARLMARARSYGHKRTGYWGRS